jgi:hypothetical protein
MVEADDEGSEEEREEDTERIQLSVAQLAASSLAALSAAVICSFFGVAGTVIGAAIASVVATTGSALYSYSLRRTRARLRRLHQAGAASPPFAEVFKTARQQGQRIWSELPLRLLAIGVAVVFVVSFGVITVIELGTGEPLSSAVKGHSGSGTSFFGGHGSKHTPKPKPTDTPSASPTSTRTTTPTPTTSPTVTPTPSPTRTPTSIPTPTLTRILPSQSPTSHKRPKSGH